MRWLQNPLSYCNRRISAASLSVLSASWRIKILQFRDEEGFYNHLYDTLEHHSTMPGQCPVTPKAKIYGHYRNKKNT